MTDLTTGVAFALMAGAMLGLYALPQKYTKDFREENIWGMFFMMTMFLVPVVATFMVMKQPMHVFSAVESSTLTTMAVASVLWGLGVMMWGKAIHHIGLSLGFSLFIGTVILVGSIIPFYVDGLPNTNALIAIVVGLTLVLFGIVANGRAGILREADKTGEEGQSGSMFRGIGIAVLGGLLATGFSLANAVGRPPLHAASIAQGNPEWVTALAVMFPIFISGGVVMAGYFAWQLTSKQSWGAFKTSHFSKNAGLILVMAIFHYAASAIFAYAAFKLGGAGNTVGYAIFNATCVLTAIISGIVTGEWREASTASKRSLYTGMGSMVAGILVIAVGNAA